MITTTPDTSTPTRDDLCVRELDKTLGRLEERAAVLRRELAQHTDLGRTLLDWQQTRQPTKLLREVQRFTGLLESR